MINILAIVGMAFFAAFLWYFLIGLKSWEKWEMKGIIVVFYEWLRKKESYIKK